MLHHVGIEVRPEEIERSVDLWEALGFELVGPPPTLSEFVWLERDCTQIHLMPTENPVVPARGHTAVVVTDFEGVLAALDKRGFEIERRREHWGAPRALVIAPGGHRVELMARPPAPSTESAKTRL
jgi:catechol 2,3-dioxygenase-like lactoylglutathione lyase family enzyme